MPAAIVGDLRTLLRPRLGEEAASWLTAQVDLAHDRAALVSAFAAAGRRLGTTPLRLTDKEQRQTGAALLQGRGLDELGRMALLLAAADHAGGADETLVADLFYRGEAREKQALLRALPLLPVPARFREIALEACRSSVQPIFEAIACENPYPSDHFADDSFNQMVLKALFTEASVARIVGLDRRVTAELVRMAEGYGSERRAAGRRVPDDISRIAALLRRD